MSGVIELLIDLSGDVRCLYTEVIDLSQLGELHVERASHVEFDDENQTWTVRLPNNGKVIGTGFKSRRDAINHEVEHLNKFYL